MAHQLAKDNIRVNSVAPGPFLFPGAPGIAVSRTDPAGIAEFIRTELPFGEFGAPTKWARSAFLVSPARAVISGSVATGRRRQSRSLSIDDILSRMKVWLPAEPATSEA
jgi:NAD(P)-dependent dehydrogenase (short-subunit alcohol dehydrogenase family)